MTYLGGVTKLGTARNRRQYLRIVVLLHVVVQYSYMYIDGLPVYQAQTRGQSAARRHEVTMVSI